MPFTPAHIAAAYSFRRTRFVWSALIVGTMAPDFEYFLRMALEGRHGHSFPGVFLLTLPLALITLWLFHKFVKRTFVDLMPDALRFRLEPYAGDFRFGGGARFGLIIVSILVGVGTHLVWDSFTHPNGWSVVRWQALQDRVRLPFIGGAPAYKILQHASTLFGMAFLLVWLMIWYRNADTARADSAPWLSGWAMGKIATLLGIATIALVGALAISAASTGVPENLRGVPHFLVPVVVAAIPLVWWELVLLGMVQSRRTKSQKVASR